MADWWPHKCAHCGWQMSLHTMYFVGPMEGPDFSKPVKCPQGQAAVWIEWAEADPDGLVTGAPAA